MSQDAEILLTEEELEEEERLWNENATEAEDPEEIYLFDWRLGFDKVTKNGEQKIDELLNFLQSYLGGVSVLYVWAYRMRVPCFALDIAGKNEKYVSITIGEIPEIREVGWDTMSHIISIDVRDAIEIFGIVQSIVLRFGLTEVVVEGNASKFSAPKDG